VVRRWVWRAGTLEPPRTLVDAVAELGLSPPALVARLLEARGVGHPAEAAAFLRPTLATGLRSPSLLRDMNRAVRRLADALAAGERIAVYGDSDVDGMAGAAALVLCLRELGADPLLHVVDRAGEGYGLHVEVLRRLHAAGVRVVVTADCGTADEAALRAAADLGVDVVVCDHHQTPAVRPPAFALLNPGQPGCDFPFKGLAGSGVVFYLLIGLRAELRARGQARLPDLRRYLDLVALGTVADVVPLREENRVLVAHGLRALERTSRPGLVALKQAALVESASVRAVGFRLAPRLNAGGRLADGGQAVELLTTADDARAHTLAAALEVRNAERRALEEAMVAEAIAAADARPAGSAWTTVVAREGWHSGVVGIVAGRLADRYHGPALAIALEDGCGRGSGRSVNGMPLHAALADCADLLDQFGGHPQAVGFTVRRERVGELAARFEAAVRRRASATDLEPILPIDAEISLATITPELAATLAALEPYGPGNPEPTLLARGVDVEGVRLVGDPAQSHLKLRLRQDGRTVSAIGFRLGHLPVRRGDRLDLVCTPRLARWQGIERLELEVSAVRGTRGSEVTQAPENTAKLQVS